MSGCPRPNLGYENAPAAIRFLVGSLGFESSVIYEGPDGSIAHAELSWPTGGGVTIHTASPENSIARTCAGRQTHDSYPGFSIHIDVEDPDELYSRVEASGATIVHPLADSPHGTRGFVVKDLEGLYWSLGTPLPRQIRDRDRWAADTEVGGLTVDGAS